MPRKYIKKRLNSFGYALRGMGAAFRYEPNMKLHVLAAIEAIFLGWFFHIKPSEWCWIILAIGLVWMAEIFNTALEKLTDLVSPDYHELAGQAKDLAAGAVLMAAFTALAIGILIFWPYVAALPVVAEWLKNLS
ncbi:diacylglycerol kinase family protein [Adhaeribacter soli]|uniref:Diacylglycerol kinase family protein n=1 Tax=Adhaeribacter soli TaxID=2607655 RepID=A0A5N1J0L1_9BACT|nr:diacylglycerol kinase family protein [Adhaeribacter soli]KAA9340024.1 diacylglycerol kinase family protein [Adhaeribacter soli]